jgi:hypothetical protein
MPSSWNRIYYKFNNLPSCGLTVVRICKLCKMCPVLGCAKILMVCPAAVIYVVVGGLWDLRNCGDTGYCKSTVVKIFSLCLAMLASSGYAQLKEQALLESLGQRAGQPWYSHCLIRDNWQP